MDTKIILNMAQDTKYRYFSVCACGVCVCVCECVPHQDEYKQLWGRRIFVNDMESQIFTLDSTQNPSPTPLQPFHKRRLLIGWHRREFDGRMGVN